MPPRDVYGVQVPAELVEAVQRAAAPVLEEWGPTIAAGVALFRAVTAAQKRRRK